MNIICFHNPDEENGYLSNWYGCTFKVNGILFSSMEQFMMYKKAERFGDHLISHQHSAQRHLDSTGDENKTEKRSDSAKQRLVFAGFL